MKNHGSGQDREQIKQVRGPYTKTQRQLVEDRLGAGNIGRDIEHVSSSVSRCKQVDGSGNHAEEDKTGDRVPKTAAASVRASADSDQNSDQNQKTVPEISMESQGPVNMPETIGDDQSSKTAHQVIILHEGIKSSLWPSGGKKRQDQTQIHGQAAKLEREKPPIVALMLDLVKKKQLLVQLSCGQKTATEKKNAVCGSFRQRTEPEKNRFLHNEIVYHFL